MNVIPFTLQYSNLFVCAPMENKDENYKNTITIIPTSR